MCLKLYPRFTSVVALITGKGCDPAAPWGRVLHSLPGSPVDHSLRTGWD